MDQQEAATFEDELPSAQAKSIQGLFGVSVAEGRLTIHAPLILRGRMSREELQTRTGETEVLIRRALEPELDEIRKNWELKEAERALGEFKEMELSADDMLVLLVQVYVPGVRLPVVCPAPSALDGLLSPSHFTVDCVVPPFTGVV